MRVPALLTVLFLAAAPAMAAPPSPESIERLLTITQMEKNMTASPQMSRQMIRTMADRQAARYPITPEQRKKMDTMIDRLIVVMSEEMAWPKMKPMLVQIYSESFTQEEVDGVLAFYESPAGEALIAKMPVVMQKSMQMVQQMMEPLMRRVEAELKAAIEAK